jgi:serine/threonine protein kinase
VRGLTRRIRLYTAGSALDRAAVTRAAEREVRLLEGIEHPGILRPLGYHVHEIGPALVFEYDPKAVLLDHYMHQHVAHLGIDLRLHLVREIADALRYAHEKRLYHRALNPRSILVRDADGDRPRIQLFNWQTAARESLGSSGHATATAHLADLVDEPAAAYLAPEALTDPSADGEALDVFSLGAIAFLVLSGRAPASSALELGERVRDGNGLRIASALDGAGAKLAELIQWATHPSTSSRLDSVRDFLDLLEGVEDELTTPDRGEVKSPEDAGVGDHLDGGWLVKKRLGRGATAVVFLVERDGRELVLKLANDIDQNDRIADEALILERLRHDRIVAYRGIAEVAGRKGILMDKAGDETLAQRLRNDGPLHIDLLQRFGEDLLEVVRHLGEKAVPHRDIKPENLGVAPSGSKALHLVLFDFSLSKTPADRIRAGTAPYLDPFISLRKPPLWDVYAERFGAAMTLHEMTTGTLPRWGDGRSDPSVLDCEVTLDTELFDPTLREPLTTFFRRALARDVRARFDNAEDMQRAWRKVFEDVDRPAVGASTDNDDGSTTTADGRTLLLDGATLDSLLVSVGLSTRALNALLRVNVLSVRDLLALPARRIVGMRGVGHRTRRELADVLQQLQARFPGVEARSEPASTESSDNSAPLVSSVDLLADRLLVRRADAADSRALRALLSLDDGDGSAAWRSQTIVAEELGVTRARVGQILGKARERWARDSSFRALRDDIGRLLAGEGGVMTCSELAAAVLATRGSTRPDPERRRLANAVTRAAVETEQGAHEPRWIVSRTGDRVFVALDDHDGQMLNDLAKALGEAADRIAERDPLPSPARATEELQRASERFGLAVLSPTRLVRLAAAASSRTAVSPRLELYPREPRLSAARALKLAHGALLGNAELTVAHVQERVAGRYPEAEPLPGRPALDDLLRDAGWDFRWEPEAAGGKGAYHSTAGLLPLTSGSSTTLTRMPSPLSGPPRELTPEETSAVLLDRRLTRAAEEGAFLLLSVEPRHVEAAAEALVSGFPIERVSLEAVLIAELKATAATLGADWNVVLRADAAPLGSFDRTKLGELVDRALSGVEQRLATATRTLLLVWPGLLARYDRIDFLEKLRDRIGLRRSPKAGTLHGAWVLVPSDDLRQAPVLDGRPLPVISASEWARLTEPWLRQQPASSRTKPAATVPARIA